jgi:hypothetical protein
MQSDDNGGSHGWEDHKGAMVEEGWRRRRGRRRKEIGQQSITLSVGIQKSVIPNMTTANFHYIIQTTLI